LDDAGGRTGFEAGAYEVNEDKADTSPSQTKLSTELPSLPVHWVLRLTRAAIPPDPTAPITAPALSRPVMAL
jgi:hypothetical protein